MRQGLRELDGLSGGDRRGELEQAGSGEICDHRGDAGIGLGPIDRTVRGGADDVGINDAEHGAGRKQDSRYWRSSR